MSRIREDVEEAVRSALAGHDVDAAVTAAIKGYGPEVMGFLGGRMQDDTAAGDVFAQFCEDLWKGMPTFAWRSSVRVWCYVLARNAANRYSKRVVQPGRRNVGLSQADGLSALVERVRTSTAIHLKTETKTRAQRLRAQLSPEDRAVLILRVDKQLSWDELAIVYHDGDDTCDVKREAARLRKRFQLAKERLRKLAVADGLIGGGR